MLDLDQLSDGIYDILEPIVNPNELIVEHDDGVRPQGTYSSFKIISLDQVGYTDLGGIDVTDPDNATTTITAHYDLTLRIGSYGEDAKTQTHNLNFRILNDPNILEKFQALGLEQFNTPIINDLPVFRDSDWVERSQSTIAFHFAHTETVPTGWIEKIGYYGEYFKQGNSTPVYIDDRTSPNLIKED